MRRCVFLGSALVSLVAVAPHILAQSKGSFAAMGALVGTPIGALPPSITSDLSAERFVAPSGQFRYSRWKAGDFSLGETHNFSFGFTGVTQRGEVGFTVGMQHSACTPSCDIVMASLEYTEVLVRAAIEDTDRSQIATLSVGINPAIGYGRPTRGHAHNSAMAAAVSFPVTISIPLGLHTILAPFVTPGLGFGRLVASGFSSAGVRPIVGGGIAVANVFNRFSFTVGARSVFLSGSPAPFGLTLGYHAPY